MKMRRTNDFPHPYILLEEEGMEKARKKKLILVDRDEYSLERCLLTDIIYTAIYNEMKGKRKIDE